MSRLQLNDHLVSAEEPRRSEDAYSFLSQRPSFVERNGIQIIACIFVILLLSTWFVKFPDRIIQQGYLSADNAPIEIKPKTEGVLDRLLVANGEMVEKGQVLAWLSSEIGHQDVLTLLAELEKVETVMLFDGGRTDRKTFIRNTAALSLGELQQHYSAFISSFLQYEDYNQNGFYRDKIAAARQEIHNMQLRNRIIEEQMNLSRKDISISRETYAVDHLLEKSSLVTKDELRRTESQIIGKEKGHQELVLSLMRNETSIKDKAGDITQLNHDIGQNSIQFAQAVRDLKARLTGWVDRHAIRANTAGKVEYSSFLHERQLILANRPIGYVIPANSGYFLKTTLGQNALGKLEKNIPVEIRFSGYPFKEFGSVEGRLVHISDIAVDSGFLSKVAMPQGLQTSLGHKIPYRENLRAEAVFVTKDIRLLKRLFNSLVRTKNN